MRGRIFWMERALNTGLTRLRMRRCAPPSSMSIHISSVARYGTVPATPVFRPLRVPVEFAGEPGVPEEQCSLFISGNDPESEWRPVDRFGIAQSSVEGIGIAAHLRITGIVKNFRLSLRPWSDSVSGPLVLHQ